jgi:peptidoglycan/xylan/chitin deacetylase (PgdA/CDA1 family)
VVLAYHRVGGGSGLDVDLDPGLFDEQMAYLAQRGTVQDLDGGIERLDGDEPRSSVVVTFDDGTVDFMDHALPSLIDNGVEATYYIATRFVDEQLPFPNEGTPLTWTALAEAVSTGLVTVGCHTHSHAVVDKLSPEATDEEMRRSTGLIEDRLGVTAHHFAYPKGVFGGEANEAAVARYCRSAALAECGVNPPGSTDRLRLRRSPIQQSDGMRYFEKKVAGGMVLEGTIRDLLNRSRYASSQN